MLVYEVRCRVWWRALAPVCVLVAIGWILEVVAEAVTLAVAVAVAEAVVASAAWEVVGGVVVGMRCDAPPPR